VDAGTAVYAELRLRAEDEAARELLRSVFEAAQPRELPDEAEMPEPLRWALGGIPRRRASDKELNRILPIVVVQTRQEASPGAAGPPLFGVSFPRAGNSMRLVDAAMSFVIRRSREGARREVHHGESLYRLSEGGRSLWACIVGTDVLIAADDGPVRAGIDRLLANAKGPPPEDPLMAARPADGVLYLAAREGHAPALGDLVGAAFPAVAEALRPALREAGPATLWARLRSADLLEGEIRVEEPAAGPAAGRAREVPEVSGSLTAALQEGEVAFAFAPLPAEPGVRGAWRIEVRGLAAAARHALEALPRAGRDRSRVRVRP
jgi:hypothetical protein